MGAFARTEIDWSHNIGSVPAAVGAGLPSSRCVLVEWNKAARCNGAAGSGCAASEDGSETEDESEKESRCEESHAASRAAEAIAGSSRSRQHIAVAEFAAIGDAADRKFWNAIPSGSERAGRVRCRSANGNRH